MGLVFIILSGNIRVRVLHLGAGRHQGLQLLQNSQIHTGPSPNRSPSFEFHLNSSFGGGKGERQERAV